MRHLPYSQIISRLACTCLVASFPGPSLETKWEGPGNEATCFSTVHLCFTVLFLLLFSALIHHTYICTCTHTVTHTHTHTHTHCHTHTHTQGEAYSDPVKTRRQERLKQAKKNLSNSFVPTSGSKKP